MLTNYQTVLSNKKQLTTDQLILKFSLIEPKELIFKAGQYLILKVNSQTRLYSIYSSSNVKNYFELMVKIVPGGLASNYLNNLKVGDKVNFQGPAGMFTLHENERNKVFFATFTGMAPQNSMILSYLENNKNKMSPQLYLFWGLRNFSDICLVEELKQLSINYRQFKFTICLSRENNLSKIRDEDRQYFKLGRVNAVWEEFMSQQSINLFDYYLCASRDVVESLNQYLLGKGITKENIFFEKF